MLSFSRVWHTEARAAWNSIVRYRFASPPERSQSPSMRTCLHNPFARAELLPVSEEPLLDDVLLLLANAFCFLMFLSFLRAVDFFFCSIKRCTLILPNSSSTPSGNRARCLAMRRLRILSSSLLRACGFVSHRPCFSPKAVSILSNSVFGRLECEGACQVH